MLFIKNYFRYNYRDWLKVKGYEKIHHTCINVKEVGMTILMSDKTDVKPKMVIRDRKGHYIMIKSSIHWEDITVINICIHNFGAPKCIKSSKVWKEKQTTIK